MRYREKNWRTILWKDAAIKILREVRRKKAAATPEARRNLRRDFNDYFHCLVGGGVRGFFLPPNNSVYNTSSVQVLRIPFFYMSFPVLSFALRDASTYFACVMSYSSHRCALFYAVKPVGGQMGFVFASQNCCTIIFICSSPLFFHFSSQVINNCC